MPPNASPRIRLVYTLSEAGRRAALARGMAPEERQVRELAASDAFFAPFAELVDPDRAAEQGPEGPVYELEVGRPYGFRPVPSDYDLMSETYTPARLDTAPDEATRLRFDDLPSLRVLLRAERRHRKAREAARAAGDAELARLQEAEKEAHAQWVRQRIEAAEAWMFEHLGPDTHDLPQVQKVRLKIARGEDPGSVLGGDVKAMVAAVRAAEDLAEARAWCHIHGSRRLQLLADQGFLETNLALYRQERMAKELPEWAEAPPGQDLLHLERPSEPSEEALERLAAARKALPEAELWWWKEGRRHVVRALFLGVPVEYRPALPRPVPAGPAGG